MATPNIVPRADSEGGLGTASKYWGSAYIDAITTTGNVTVGGVLQVEASSSPNFQLYRSGTGQLWNFSVDSSGRIQLKEAASLGGTKNTRLQIDDDGQVDITSGALTISSDGANAATLTESASGDFTIASVDDLRLEAGGNDVVLKGASSVEYGRLTNDSGSLNIQNTTEDKDIKFEAKNTAEGTETYLIIDGSARTVNFTRHTFQPDGIETRIGTGNDLKIVHDGANSNIENTTGALFLLNREADGDIIFKSDDGSGSAITEYFRVDGGEGRLVHTANSRYLDNATVMLGSSADLQIKHDGSHSYISQGGTGNLYIQQNVNNADLMFQCDDGNDNTTTYFYLDGSSATHDGTATTGLYTNWPDNSRISLGTSHDLQLWHGGIDSYIVNGADPANQGNLYIMNKADDKDIIFQASTGSASSETYIQLDGSLGITTFYKNLYLLDDVQIRIGTGSDLKIYHDATNSYISNITGHVVIQNDAGNKDIIFKADSGSGVETYFQLDGSEAYTSFSKNLRILDSVYTQYGTSGDFSIGHNGTNTTVQNYTGDLTITNNADGKDIIFQSDDGNGGTETYFYLDGSMANSGNALRYTVFPDNSTLLFGGGSDLRILHDGTDSSITNTTGNFNFYQNTDGGDIRFYNDNGSGGTTEYFRLDGGDSSTQIKTIKVLMPNLPTSDPTVAGQLWNDSGTLKISAG